MAAGGDPWNFSFHWKSATVITNKHYFVTGFLGDSVVKEKYSVILYFIKLFNL